MPITHIGMQTNIVAIPADVLTVTAIVFVIDLACMSVFKQSQLRCEEYTSGRRFKDCTSPC